MGRVTMVGREESFGSYDPNAGRPRPEPRPSLSQDVRIIVWKRLEETAEQFEANWDAVLDGATLRDALRLPDGATVAAALAFHDTWSRGACDRDAVARVVRALEEQLHAHLADVGRVPESLSDRRDRCLGLAMWLSYCFVPAVAWLGQYSIALEAAAAYFTLISGRSHELVVGAGNPGPAGGHRLLLMMPLLWSLALHHP